MTDTVDYARRELALRMRHAFGHDMGGAHHHLNLDAFMRELERFIDSKIAEANNAQNHQLRPPRSKATKRGRG